MQVIETLHQGLQRGCSITLSAAELKARINEKLKAAREDFQRDVAGAGRVSDATMETIFSQSMLEEAVQESVGEALIVRLEESGERLALQTHIELKAGDWNEGGDVRIDLTYEVLPEVPEIDFSEIKLERPVTEVDEEAIAEALGKLAGSANYFEERETGARAQEGDQVVIDFLGKLGGEPFEGGTAQDYSLVLGSNSFVPGFEEQLTGAKTGENLEVMVRFPSDYGAAQLAGKDVVFECKVKKVRVPKAAPIDNDLARRFGVDSLESLKGQLSGRLAEDYADAARAVVKRRLLDALDEMVKFDLPPSMVEAEANGIAHQLWHDENPDVQGHDHDAIEPTEELRAIAERRVRLGLLFAAVGERNGISVSDAEMRQAILRQANQYPGQEQEVSESIEKNEQAQRQLSAPMFEDKVVDHIAGLVEMSEKSVSKEELRRAVEELDLE